MLFSSINKNILLQWMVFLAVGLVAIMINMDMTVVNLALVSISKEFNSTLSQMQWVVNIYMLTNITFIIFGGRLADIFNEKTIYVIGILIFLLASILCGIAPNQYVLIVARAIQGVGFAFTLTLGVIIATSVFPEERRGFVLGCYMTVAGIAQALGPTVGGGIIQYLGWRYIFWVNIPFGILALLLITKFYKGALGSRRNAGKINISDVALLGAGLFILVFVLNKVGDSGVMSTQFILTLIFSFGVLWLFYLKQNKTKNSLIDFKIFSSRDYLLISIVRFTYMFNRVSIIFILPFYLQNIIGFSPILAGLVLFCMTAVSGGIAPVVGMWLDKTGFRKPILSGILLTFVALVLLANINGHLLITILMMALVLLGVSAPIVGSASAAVAIRSLPKEKLGSGLGTFYTSAFLGSALGVAITGSVFTILAENNFANIISLSGVHFSPVQLSFLRKIVNGGAALTTYAREFSAPQLKFLYNNINNNFLKSLSVIMWVNAVLSAGSLILSYFLQRDDKNKSKNFVKAEAGCDSKAA